MIQLVWLAGVALALSLSACSADPEREVRETLRDYEAAFEARDLARLVTVWEIPFPDRGLIREFLARAETVSVWIDPAEVVVGVDTATVDFYQRLEFSGLGGAGYDQSRLTASLARNPKGRWKIAQIARQEGQSGRVWVPPSGAWSGYASSLRSPPPSVGAAAPDRGHPGSARPDLAPPERPPRPTVADTLRAYRHAFESRDLDALAKVWRLTAIERVLIERVWEGCTRVSLEIDAGDPRIDIDEASVALDQTLVLECPERIARVRSNLEVTLARGDDASWVIVALYPRETLEGRARPDPGHGPASGSADRTAILTALSHYESALGGCDLVELARVWIMNPRERGFVEEICQEHQSLSVAISAPQVAMTPKGARVDFTQNVTYPALSGVHGSRSELTALMVRRVSGEWAIWRIRDSD